MTPDRKVGEISLKRLDADAWRLWRDLRLDALAEAPYAFSATLADWQVGRDTEARWCARLSEVPFNLIAHLNQTPAGMVSATATDSDGIIDLISMWVSPSARGRGVGDALVTAIIDWARGEGASTVALDVYDSNERAINVYRRHRFIEVSGVVGRCSGSARELHMIRKL